MSPFGHPIPKSHDVGGIGAERVIFGVKRLFCAPAHKVCLDVLSILRRMRCCVLCEAGQLC